MLSQSLAWSGEPIGRTYAIAEPDVMSEIEERASKIDWEAKAKKIDLRAKMRAGSVRLPPAEKDQEYPVDLTYRLSYDIPDGKGGMLYPKGYQFNPVAFIQLPYRLGVIGPSAEERAWAKSQKGPIVWMTAGGDPIELTEALGQSVFLYTPEMAERITVQHTPALVTQEGDRLVVREYAIARGGR